jgi:hypothetical protein
VAGTAATIVPYGDEDRLAHACLALLGSADRRRSQSTAGSQRARSLFALRTTIDAVRTVYADATTDTADLLRRITLSDADIANELVGAGLSAGLPYVAEVGKSGTRKTIDS